MKLVRPSSLGIRYKLFLLFLVLIVAPFAVYTAITIRQSSRNAERSGRYSARQVLLQAGQFIESRVGRVRRSLVLTTLDPQVRGLSAADPAVYERNVSQWIVDAARLRSVVLAIGQSDPDISGFALYMERGPAAYSESGDLRHLAGERAEEWHRRMVEEGGNLRWFPPRFFPAPDGVPRFHGVARIPDDMDLGRTVGYVRIDVPTSALEEILDQAEFSASSSAFLLDAAGEPIARSQRARGPDRALLGPARAAFSAGPGREEAPRTLLIEGRRFLADCLYLGTADWRLILLVPYEDIDAFGDAVRRQMLIAVAVILPLTLPLALWAASSSTRRIDRLIQGVREFERGNLAVRVPGESGDEIGELTGDLNRMASRITSLLEERYALGQEMKNLEMKALQAQINPHFLYNTLDLVNCLSIRAGAPTIGAAVEALSRFYRLSLSGGAETVSVQQELEHVQTYVRIQNMRFDDGIVLVTEVPGEVRALLLPKIVLQPLVENAILHGIRERETGRGTVTLRGRTVAGGPEPAPEVLELVIEDDGVGMAARRVEELLLGERTDEGHGYGLRNIDRRLKVKYGEAYGLSFRSEPGRGTSVTIRMPALRPGEAAPRSPGGGHPPPA